MSKESLTSSISAKEKAIQQKKQPTVAEADRTDLVDESQVNDRVVKIEDRLAKSALSDEYKGNIKKALGTLMDEREAAIKGVKDDADTKLKEVFAKTIKDLEEFDKQPGVKEIYEVLEPFFVNKEKIKPVVNLVEYKRDSGYWEKINEKIKSVSGIGQDKITELQKMLKVKVDGKAGPETINAMSKMMDLGINVKFSDKTLYAGEIESEEEKAAKANPGAPSASASATANPGTTPASGSAKANPGATPASGSAKANPGAPSAGAPSAPAKNPTIKKKPAATAEVNRTVEAEFAKLSALEANLKSKTQAYTDNIMGNGFSSKGHEGDKDAYRDAFMAVVNGMGKIAELNGGYELNLPRKSANVMLLVVDQKEHGGLKAIEGQMAIPGSKADFVALKSKVAANFLQERRSDYFATGDKRYKPAFDKSQTELTDNLRTDVNAGLKNAGDEDGKIEGSTVDPGLKKSMETDVNVAANKIVDEFDALQRMQAEDPLAAYHASVKFHDKMKAFRAENAGDSRLDFATLKKLPNLRAAFFKVVDSYDQQATLVAVKSSSQNREVREYVEVYQNFNSSVAHLMKSINKIFEDLRKGEDEPSELVMANIHEVASEVLNGPMLKKLQNSRMAQFAALKYFQGEDDFESKSNMGLKTVKDAFSGVRGEGFENDHIGSKEYIEAVISMCGQVRRIEGSPATWNSFLKDTGKELAIVTAAVAGAVAMGALVTLSGGIAGAGLLVAAGNIGITAVATGLGAAIGSQYMQAAIEGNADNIGSSEVMLKAWGTGAAYTAGGMAAGVIFGTVLGKGAATVAGRTGGLAQKAAVYAEQYGTKVVAQAGRAAQVQGSGFRSVVGHYFKEVASETREELVENALEKIGQGVAPNHPWLGFALSMIPATTKQAKASFVQGVNVKMAGKSMDLNYSEKSAARGLMISKGVPVEAIAEFDKSGKVSVDVGDLHIDIKPAPAPEVGVDMKLDDANALYDKAGTVAGAKELLGITGDITAENLKQAYRDMAQKYHPDKHANSEVATAIFQAVSRANATLKPLIGFKANVRTDKKADKKTEAKAEVKPDIDSSTIKDVKLRDRVNKYVQDLWADVKNSSQLDSLNKKWAEMKDSVAKASQSLYVKIEQRLIDLTKNIKPKEWLDAQLQKISDLQLRKKTGDVIDSLFSGAGKMKKAAWDAVSKKWAEISVAVAKVNPDLKAEIDEKVEEVAEVAEVEPEIKQPENSDSILSEYMNKMVQPNLSNKLVQDGIFKIESTVEIGGVKYHVGPVYAHEGRYYSVMMADTGNGVLMPRILYYSSSQGAWRSTRGMGSGGTYSKGVIKGGYAQETLVIPEIAEKLAAKINQNKVQPIKFDPVKQYFSRFDTDVQAIDTYDNEGIYAVNAPELTPFLEQGYQPGAFHNTNATDYFRSLDSSFPPGFVPNFSQAPVSVRAGEHSILGKTVYETYETQYKNNRLHWEMARTPDGKVWVERIVFPDSPVTSYGTSKAILLTGLLTAKPLEYNDNQVGGLLKAKEEGGRYKEVVDFGNDTYVDITPLIDNLLPIRQYREARGVVRNGEAGYGGNRTRNAAN